MLNIIQKKNIWFAFSGSLVLLGAIALFLWGLPFGIDFTGGSLLEAKLEQPATPAELRETLAPLNLGDITIQETGRKSFLFRTKDLSEETHQNVLGALGEKYGSVEELSFESVGSSLGKELQQKTFYAFFAVLAAIILYIAWAFRKVSRPVQSWKYGVIAVVTLFHDVFITIGIFAIISHFTGYEIGLPFVAAILTILGYSVNDTIVVFDRIRENISHDSTDFETIVNKSVNQTMSRSINTSFTTLLALAAVYFFGGSSLQYFTLTLIIGIVKGTYSSIFIASPLLVVWNKLGTK